MEIKAPADSCAADRRRWRGSNLSTVLALMLDDASARSCLVGSRDLQPPPPIPPPHTHTNPFPPSQAPLGAGGRFGSQCKYIFSLSKTHFPTTVKGEEGTSEGSGATRKERERREVGGGGEGFFFPLFFPPFSLVCCCLPGSSNIWHCLSPGLLVQAGRERLKGEHSANLSSAIAGLKDHSDLL